MPGAATWLICCLSASHSPPAFAQEEAPPPDGEATLEEPVSGETSTGGIPSVVREAVPFGLLLGSSDATSATAGNLVPGRIDTGKSVQGLSGQFGTGLNYNTNLYQDPEALESGAVSTTDMQLSYRLGTERPMGMYLVLNYDLAYFHYLDEKLNEGREPFDHSFGGFLGIKGASTTVTITGSFVQNNGNGNNLERLDRESLQSPSNDYSVSVNATRKLRRTSLNGGLNYRFQDYIEGGDGDAVEEARQEDLTDLSQWGGNLGWSITPTRLPKFDFRPTLRFGASEQKEGSDQTFINPSLGVAYSFSPKLAFNGSVGADIRESSVINEEGEEESFTTSAPTFELGASWQPTATTGLGANISRRTSPSSLRGETSSDTTSISLSASKQFPKGIGLSASYSLQMAEYTDESGDVIKTEPSPDENGNQPTGRRGRPEDYHVVSVSLGKQIQIRPTLTMSVSLFYQYTHGSSPDPLSEFEQSIIGMRVGMGF